MILSLSSWDCFALARNDNRRGSNDQMVSSFSMVAMIDNFLKLFSPQSMEKIIQTLQAIGLNEKESRIYLILLQLGPQPVSIIAQKIGMNRSSCYAILEKLLKKGYIEKLIQEKNTNYRAVKPHFILDQLKTKQYDLASKIEKSWVSASRFQQLKK